MTPEDIRLRLKKLVSRGRLPAGFDADDMVNEALRMALAEVPTPEGQELFERAKAAVPEIRRDAYWRTKREQAVRREAKNAPDGNPATRRRGSRRRQLPKGTIRFATHEVGPSLLPVGEGDVLNDDYRGAAERLVEALLRIAAGEPCSSNGKRLIAKLYGELHGVPPGSHWAHLMIVELERAKEQATELSRSEEEATAESFAVFTRKGQKEERIRLFAVQTPTLPGRVRQDYFIEEKGERVLIGRCAGILGDEFIYSTVTARPTPS